MVTTAMAMPSFHVSVVTRHRVRPGPGVCCVPDPVTGPPGMRCELLKEREPRCRRAKSARFCELRPEVYTDPAGGLSTGALHRSGSMHKTGAAGGAVVGAALNSIHAMGHAPDSGTAVRGPGTGRERAFAVAVAATSGRRPGIRRPVAELESRTPGRGPGRSAGTARLRGRGCDGGVRRAAGRAAGRFAGPPRGFAHQLRAGAGGRSGRPAGDGRDPD